MMARTRGGSRTGSSSRNPRPDDRSEPAQAPLREDGFRSAATRAWFDKGGAFVIERRITDEAAAEAGLTAKFESIGAASILRMSVGVFSPELVREFYANAVASDTTHSITSYVRQFEVEVTPESFSEILLLPDNPDAHRNISEDTLRESKTRWLSEVGSTTRRRGEEHKTVLPYAILPSLQQRTLAEILSHQIRSQAGNDASDEDCVLLDYLIASPHPAAQQISLPYVMFRQLHKVVTYLWTKKKKITPIFPIFIQHLLPSTLPEETFTDMRVREGETPISLTTFRRWGFLRLDDGSWVKGSSGLGSTGTSASSGSTPATATMAPPTAPVMSIPPEMQTLMDSILQQQQRMEQRFGGMEQQFGSVQQQVGEVQLRQVRMEGHIDDIRQSQGHLQAEQTSIAERLERSDGLHREAARFMAEASTQQAQNNQLMQMLIAQLGARPPPPPPPQ